jgi:hypothetical protein
MDSIFNSMPEFMMYRRGMHNKLITLKSITTSTIVISSLDTVSNSYKDITINNVDAHESDQFNKIQVYRYGGTYDILVVWVSSDQQSVRFAGVNLKPSTPTVSSIGSFNPGWGQYQPIQLLKPFYFNDSGDNKTGDLLVFCMSLGTSPYGDGNNFGCYYVTGDTPAHNSSKDNSFNVGHDQSITHTYNLKKYTMDIVRSKTNSNEYNIISFNNESTTPGSTFDNYYRYFNLHTINKPNKTVSFGTASGTQSTQSDTSSVYPQIKSLAFRNTADSDYNVVSAHQLNVYQNNNRITCLNSGTTNFNVISGNASATQIYDRFLDASTTFEYRKNTTGNTATTLIRVPNITNYTDIQVYNFNGTMSNQTFWDMSTPYTINSISLSLLGGSQVTGVINTNNGDLYLTPSQNPTFYVSYKNAPNYNSAVKTNFPSGMTAIKALYYLDLESHPANDLLDYSVSNLFVGM